MKNISLALLFFGLLSGMPFSGFCQSQKKSGISSQTRQIIVVVSAGWDSVQGHLSAWHLENQRWKRDFSFPVVLGKSGQGVGQGLLPAFNAEGGPVKREGDHRSPAGAFDLGPAFGYGDRATARWLKMRYLRASDTLICVDDPRSVSYNALEDSNGIKKDFASFETMHRSDGLYEWGVFVQHNSNPVQAGVGSCIFLHIWENPKTGTEGCTAMAKDQLLKLMHWLDTAKRPVLIQMPRSVYEGNAPGHGWPALAE